MSTLNLAINGKFLGQKVGRSGVYRVGYELTNAIDQVLTKDVDLASKVNCFIVSAEKETYGMNLKSVEFKSTPQRLASLNRVVWEQLVLPFMVRKQTLLNFCNLGPLACKNAYTMMHDAQVYASPGSYSRAFRAWYGFVQPRLARVNKGILTVSKFSRDELSRHRIASLSRVHVVHNGCDHVLRIAPDRSFVNQIGLKSHQYVVALANTQKHKNIGILFKAFSAAELSAITLVLFGSSTREDFERDGHVVPVNVKFVGRISDEQLSGLLMDAIALAFPSLTEGFGLPPLEAMLLGCPVVAAPCGALVEVCGDAALWANPHEAEEWTRQLALLYTDYDYATALSESGIAHAGRFTWENAARGLLSFLLKENKSETSFS